MFRSMRRMRRYRRRTSCVRRCPGPRRSSPGVPGAYRKRSGQKRSPLPDFFIGAHAAIAGYTLLTRDATRYRTYFPKVRIIAP